MSTITKRGQKWCVQVRKSGHPSVNKTFSRLTDARAWAEQIEKIAAHGVARHSFAQLIDKYLSEVLPGKKKTTQKTQHGQLIRWRGVLGQLDLRELTFDKILDGRDSLQERHGFGQATANRYMSLLNHVMESGIDSRWLKENCLKGRRYKYRNCEKARTRFLNDEEIERLLQHCHSSGLVTIVTLALHTGMRKSEILNLEWGDYDVKKHLLTIKHSKNDLTRFIPLSHHASSVLREWGKVRRLDSRLIFPSKNGKTPVNIDRNFRKAAKDAGLEAFRFHDLRHTTATFLAQAGVDALLIADILGHKTLSMTRRYAHLSEQTKRDALEKVFFKIV